MGKGKKYNKEKKLKSARVYELEEEQEIAYILSKEKGHKIGIEQRLSSISKELLKITNKDFKIVYDDKYDIDYDNLEKLIFLQKQLEQILIDIKQISIKIKEEIKECEKLLLLITSFPVVELREEIIQIKEKVLYILHEKKEQYNSQKIIIKNKIKELQEKIKEIEEKEKIRQSTSKLYNLDLGISVSLFKSSDNKEWDEYPFEKLFVCIDKNGNKYLSNKNYLLVYDDLSRYVLKVKMKDRIYFKFLYDFELCIFEESVNMYINY